MFRSKVSNEVATPVADPDFAEDETVAALNAAEAAVRQDEYLSFLEKIEDTHMDIVYTLLRDRKNREECKQFIQGIPSMHLGQWINTCTLTFEPFKASSDSFTEILVLSYPR